MRIHGVDNIAPQPLTSHDAVNGKILTTLQIRTRAAKRALAVRGMMEAVTWSFIPGQARRAVRRRRSRPEARPTRSPPTCRTCGPRCCRACSRRRSATPTGASATSRCSKCRAPMRATRPTASAASPPACGAARPSSKAPAATGPAMPATSACSTPRPTPSPRSKPAGAPVDRLQVEAGGPGWYHPGPVGHDQARAEDGARAFRRVPSEDAGRRSTCPARCAGFEVYLDAVPEPKQKPTRTKPKLELSPFQAVKRDFAFVVDRQVEAGALTRAAARRRPEADHRRLGVRRVRRRRRSATAKKSIAIEVSIQPVDKTLTDEDFEALAAKHRRERHEADGRRACGAEPLASATRHEPSADRRWPRSVRGMSSGRRLVDIESAADHACVHAALVMARAMAILPDPWLADGLLVQHSRQCAFWNSPDWTSRCGFGTKDVDLFYFDAADCPHERGRREDAVIASAACATLIAPASRCRCEVTEPGAGASLVSSSASGSLCPQLSSSADALIAVCFAGPRRRRPARADDSLDLVAPFGLDDIFSFRIVPNKAIDNRATHEEKAARAKRQWPEITVIPW